MSDQVPRESIGGGRGGMRPAQPMAGRGARRVSDPAYFEAGVTPDNDLIEVFLDGDRQPNAVKADARQGWVTSHVVNSAGEVVCDGLGRMKTETKHGDVELRRCND